MAIMLLTIVRSLMILLVTTYNTIRLMTLSVQLGFFPLGFSVVVLHVTAPNRTCISSACLEQSLSVIPVITLMGRICFGQDSQGWSGPAPSESVNQQQLAPIAINTSPLYIHPIPSSGTLLKLSLYHTHTRIQTPLISSYIPSASLP